MTNLKTDYSTRTTQSGFAEGAEVYNSNGVRMLSVWHDTIHSAICDGADWEDAEIEACYSYHDLFCNCTGEISTDNWLDAIESEYRLVTISKEIENLIFFDIPSKEQIAMDNFMSKFVNV